MKKILIVSNSIWNLENFRLNLINSLLKSNYEIKIIVPKPTEGNLSISNKNLDIHYLNFNSKAYFSITDIIFIIKFRRFVKLHSPEYVLSFTVKPNLVCSFFSKSLNYKSICNITGLGTLFLRGRIIKFLALLFYKICLKGNYYIFFHNKEDQNIFKSKNILNNNSTTIPGSGVNLKFYNYSKKIYINNQNLNFLYLGRIMRDKGIAEYLQAIDNIYKLNIKVTFTFAGKIDTKDKKLLYKFDELNNKNIINYVGNISNVKKLLEKCDCVVLPSYREGLSKSLLEASAIGRPLLVSNVPGCKDLVVNGFNGFIFEVKNYKSLQSCILKFINLDINEKIKMADNSYKNSINFDENIIINKYLNLLK